eukprot:jgi/Botrbrau1/18426/Bobra.0072s0018.1
MLLNIYCKRSPRVFTCLEGSNFPAADIFSALPVVQHELLTAKTRMFMKVLLIKSNTSQTKLLRSQVT